jgi:sulfite reductase (NADPH) hemoprotein beta-component
MARGVPQPLLRTPADEFNAVEQAKLAGVTAAGVEGTLAEAFRDRSADDVQNEAEQLAKSHGIYLEYNRAKTGKEKDWSYMIRLSVPGGGRSRDRPGSSWTTWPSDMPGAPVASPRSD